MTHIPPWPSLTKYPLIDHCIRIKMQSESIIIPTLGHCPVYPPTTNQPAAAAASPITVPPPPPPLQCVWHAGPHPTRHMNRIEGSLAHPHTTTSIRKKPALSLAYPSTNHPSSFLYSFCSYYLPLLFYLPCSLFVHSRAESAFAFPWGQD